MSSDFRGNEDLFAKFSVETEPATEEEYNSQLNNTLQSTKDFRSSQHNSSTEKNPKWQFHLKKAYKQHFLDKTTKV